MTFADALTRIPVPGGADGCHQFLLTVANIGVREGITEVTLIQQILDNIPEGGRVISHKEVSDTVRKAFHDRNGHTYRGRAHGIPITSFRKTHPSMINKFLHPKQILPEDFLAASPVPIDPDDGRQQLTACLQHLFDPTDNVFIGEFRSNGVDRIYPASTWISTVNRFTPDKFPNYIIWNPLTGEPAPLHDRTKMSLRCDNAIAKYRFALVEFDGISLMAQLRFWAGCRPPRRGPSPSQVRSPSMLSCPSRRPSGL